MHTQRLRGDSLPIELGAEFVHGRQPEVFDIAREAGLLIDRLPDVHLWKTGPRLRRERRFWERFEAITGRMKARGRDRSVAEFLRGLRTLSFSDRRLVESMIDGYFAAPLEDASEKALSTAGQPPAPPDERAQFRVVRGYARVLERLRAGLDPKRCRIRLGSVVTNVHWKRGSVRVRVDSGAVFHAARLVVTVPVGVLRAAPGAAGSILWDPEVPHARRALEGIGMGRVRKVILRFREAFWEDAEWLARRAGEGIDALDFFHAPGEVFPTWWTLAPAAGARRLTAWAGWTGGARARAPLGSRGRPASPRDALHRPRRRSPAARPSSRLGPRARLEPRPVLARRLQLSGGRRLVGAGPACGACGRHPLLRGGGDRAAGERHRAGRHRERPARGAASPALTIGRPRAQSRFGSCVSSAA